MNIDQTKQPPREIPKSQQTIRAKTAGELGINVMRRTSSQGRQTAQPGRKREKISKAEWIEINPKEITFQDIEMNQTYEAYIFVRNLTQIPRRVRIQQPQTSRFRVDYDSQGALAAGLAMKLVLQFETQQMDDFHDSIVIRSDEGFVQEVPIHALKPQPNMEFPQFVDLGYAKVGAEKVEYITFKNVGKVQGKVQLKGDGQKLKIEPVSLNITPGQSSKVKISYWNNTPQVFRSEIQVIQSWCSIIKQIDVTCTVVEYSIFFLDSQQAQTSQVEFGDLILGSPSQYHGFLVNNTPVRQQWKSLVRKGFHQSIQMEGQLLTPNEVGVEWLEKVIRCVPEKGYLEPYTQEQIRIDCRGRVTEEDIQLCANYALKPMANNPKLPHERAISFAYSLFFDFEGEKTQTKEEQMMLHISGNQIMPQLKVSKQQLKFGECPIHDTRDITFVIENTHKEQTIDVSFNKVPQFTVKPEKIIVPPQIKREIQVTFRPKNVGRVNQILEIMMIEGQFKVPLQMIGQATFSGEKRPFTRGPEALPQDFDHNKNFIDDSHLEYLEVKRKQIKSENLLVRQKSLKQTNILDLFFKEDSQATTDNDKKKLSEWEQDRHNEKLQQFHQTKENQLKYTQFLRGERASRMQKKRDQIIQTRVDQMEEKIKQVQAQTQPVVVGQDPKKQMDSDEEDKMLKGNPKATAPMDYEFQLGMMETGIVEPELNLPANNDGLFVTRPIDKYEPIQTANEKGIFKPDPLQPMRKKFPAQPVTHRDIRDVNNELRGEELQKIQAGPVEIDFGRVFVKSKITRTFHIKNDLRSSISAQIVIDREELSATYQQPQIIPSSETARFEIALQSAQIGDFRQTIKYIINGKHTFDFLVVAKICAVELELSKKEFKLQFSEDSLSMEAMETLRLTNNGNATAKFKWTLSDSKVFNVSVPEGEVQAGKSLDLQVTYRPSSLQIKDDKQFLQVQKDEKVAPNKPNLVTQLVNQSRTDEDKMILKITDGIEQIVKVNGIVNDARCILKHTLIDMKELLVCKPEVKFFSIRNTSRVPAVFKILSEKLPAACDVLPVTGKILPDESKDITIRYQAREETDVKIDISILIRGGRILKIPFQVKTIIPHIEIVQDQFDFGKLTTLGNEGQLRMTLVNHSSISAELILDLRPEKENPDAPDGIDCLQVIEAGDNDESVLRSIHEEEEVVDPKESQKLQSPDDIESDRDNQSEASSEGEMERAASKRFTLNIGANSQIEFILKFAPKDVKTYNFELPIQLSRYGKLPGLTRNLVCRGLKPKFLMDPQTIEFARKIITSIEKCFAATVEVVLSNPEKKTVGWRLDVSSINVDRVFHIHPVEGKIDPGQTVRLKTQFNPQAAGDFHKQVPVYIEDSDQSKDKPYLELILKGSAAQPKLLFDRREVLLPVVPLNVESRCSFRIINDGYENLNLRYKVFGEEGNINIKLIFNEGQNLGITKRRLRVDAAFKSAKPISFTTRIEFYDDIGHTYTLPISGTSDNCLLTNYTYQQRSLGEFTIVIQDQEKGPVMILDDDQDVQSEIGSTQNKKAVRKALSVVSSKTQGSHFSGRSTQSALGYTPIPQDLLLANKQYVTKWMNFYVYTQNMHSFPESVIESEGSQIFELVSQLSGKPPLPFQLQQDKQVKKQDRIKLLINQYDELIRMLKSEGALLNHIRPYHLLSYNDLNFYLKMLPKEETDMIHPAVLKITQQRYNYISIDSWCALFYQIVKIYLLARVNHKYFRQIPNMPGGDRSNLPDCYVHGSNLYSSHEGVLLRWLEVHHELYLSGSLAGQANQQNISNSSQGKRLTTFDTDLRNGLVLASLIQSYVGQNTAKYFVGMKKENFILEEDYNQNAQKVFKALQEINLITPFDIQNFAKPSGREMMLLVLHLYNTIINYVPKGPPVIFQCVLGKECVRQLDIYNPTNKTVSYWVKYEGVPDFTLEGEDCFKIEPKSTVKYKIKFTSRVSQPVSGRITFTNKRESSTAAATIVYDLKSQIVGRVSEQTQTVKACLYETKDFTISGVNKFANPAQFQVTLIHERIEKPEARKKRNLYPSKEQQTEIFPSIFFRGETTQKLGPGRTFSVQLQFIPLIMETQRCLIIFNDPNVGEFQYEIVGIVDPPEQVIEYKAPTVYVDQPVTHDYAISLRNDAMMKARKAVEQLMFDRKQKKVINFPGGQPEQTIFDIELAGSLGFVTTPKQFTLNDHHKQKQNQKLQQQSDNTQKFEQTQTLKSNKDLSKLEQSMLSTQEQTVAASNKIPITYTFKSAVRDLNVYLTLKNSDKTDVRKYKILVNALPKPVKAQIEMNCSARENVIQEIPIVNPSDRDWSIKVTLATDMNTNQSPVFYLLNQQDKDEVRSKSNAYKDILVKRKSTLIVQLVFSPRWIGEYAGTLILQNPSTNDMQDYSLKGIAEEPLAECHITLKCQARRTTRREIPFHNMTQKTQNYRVETDVINASGATTFSIPPGKKYQYVFSVTPTLSGQYTGSITFYSDDGEYIWYTILLDTDSPRAEKDYELITTVQKPVAFDIEITNPMQADQATFEVIINGENLIGEKYFTVLPGTSSTYELIYLPLLPGSDRGQIGFIHTKLGEIWYNLTLVSKERSNQKLQAMKSELGKVCEQEIQLENPTAKEVIANVISTNPINFEVLPETIILSPFEVTIAHIRYIPSNLDSQSGEITIYTKELGKWEFLVFGQGIPPTAYKEKIITVGLNKDHSEVVLFKNPFKDAIQVLVTMESQDEEALEVFKLLLKTKKHDGKLTIQGMQQIQIPFSFTPREIRSYKCEVVISMNDKIKWRFPLIGHTESFATGPQAYFKTKCRIPMVQEFRFQLPGMGFSSQVSRFSSEIKSDEAVVNKCFKMKMMNTELREGEDSLSFEARFTPMKPFKATVDLLIKREEGGVWKFPVILEANPPDVDDLIVITSPLQKTSSVSFKLTNRFKQYTTFSAYFTANSDQEFTVSPKSGLLEPFGRDGTQFIISFTPLEYGQIKQGKLVIETDDMYWSYNLKGTLPKYIPPVVRESKIDDKLDLENNRKLQTHKPKNFIQQNIMSKKSDQTQTRIKDTTNL